MDEEITITGTYQPGDAFYACPLNTEYLQAKQKIGGEVDLVDARSEGLQSDASFTHHSTWRKRVAQ